MPIMNSREPGVTVVIVAYGSRDVLPRCLDAIERHHEVIVVDNASPDDGAEIVETQFPQVRLIRSPRNVGFGAANNLGMDSATRKWTLFLNADAFAEPGAIDRLVAEVEAAHAVAGGGRLLNPDGSLQQSVAGPLTLGAVFREQFLLERLFNGYWRTPTGDQTIPVDQVMGACLLVPTGLERFDERYFLYCEDTDLCSRLARHGPIVYVPGARFTHLLGASSENRRWLAVARYNLGKEIYFGDRGGRAICWTLDRAGAAVRLVLWLLATVATLGGTRAKVGLFWRVLTARSRDLDPR